MRQTIDPLATLLAPDVIARAEQMNMPYLGYHFLRETMTQKLLGESEPPILYWMGKDIGSEFALKSAADLSMLFIRLGLGKLELVEETSDYHQFSLTHLLYDHLPGSRLKHSLSFECGIIAGAVGRCLKKKVRAELVISPIVPGKQRLVTIHVYSEDKH
ncbi:DUF2507 domain-containing protein [Brevibacillus massiliensis]|jgi:predicted hydrocarbon binding protein|uniref:DUF2507 domain-containing protein n=1 Tax=Brevibacillus massiliensis TaxID=1118054 RepID=UPI0002ED3274|nr:DUF2507 domain-containing protein [Brevibacillus massiliensis]